MKNLLICFIGTGNYLNFLPNYYENVTNNFCPDCNKTILITLPRDTWRTDTPVLIQSQKTRYFPFKFSPITIGYFI